jgi:GNAT superfamily N-acetyltransferase
MSKKRIKVVCRQATLDDVEAIYKLDQEVWTEFPGTREMFASRIETFPEGNFIAEVDGRGVGYLCLELIDIDLSSKKQFTWDEISDRGTIRRSHSYNGNYMYGIAMTIAPCFQGQGIGTQLVLCSWSVGVNYNVRGVLIGSRIPHFHKYANKMSIEEYTNAKNEKGEYLDPELRLWSRDGFKPILILPNYINDPDSLHYGILVYRRNPFFNWPLRKCIAYVMSTWGPKFIRSNF